MEATKIISSSKFSPLSVLNKALFFPVLVVKHIDIISSNLLGPSSLVHVVNSSITSRSRIPVGSVVNGSSS